MKKIDVYLDDWRIAPEGWVQAWNYEELVDIFEDKNVEVEYLSLDNDLGLDKTGNKSLDGLDFIKNEFIEKGFYCKKIFVHSGNNIAKEYIISKLRDAKKVGAINKDIEIVENAFPVSKKNRGNVFKDSF